MEILLNLKDLDSVFYLKILLIIFVVIMLVVFFSKVLSIIVNKRKDINFEKKQEKIKQKKQNTADLNKRFGISGRLSSASFTETIDIEDIKENNNVELRHERLSSKDLR